MIGIKGINTAGQSPAPAAYGGFPQQSCGVLNPIFPHSLDHVRASASAFSLISSIIGAMKEEVTMLKDLLKDMAVEKAVGRVMPGYS